MSLELLVQELIKAVETLSANVASLDESTRMGVDLSREMMKNAGVAGDAEPASGTAEKVDAKATEQAAAATGTRRGRPPKNTEQPASGAAAETAPAITIDQVKAAGMKVKAEKGIERARKVAADLGVKDMAELVTKPQLFPKYLELCEAALNEGAAEVAEEDDGL